MSAEEMEKLDTVEAETMRETEEGFVPEAEDTPGETQEGGFRRNLRRKVGAGAVALVTSASMLVGGIFNSPAMLPDDEDPMPQIAYTESDEDDLDGSGDDGDGKDGAAAPEAAEEEAPETAPPVEEPQQAPDVWDDVRRKLQRLPLGVRLLAVPLAALLCGCVGPKAREVQLDQQAMSAAIEPQDVRRTVEKMVDSMLADREFIAEYVAGKPVLDIGPLQNRSTMHLDMQSITDSIRTKLIRSRKFRFMDRTTSATDLQFMNDQALNGMTDPSKAVAAGQQSAAQLYLYGALTEMRQQVDGVTDRYFKFTLNMKDIASGEIAWTDEQEIRKQQTKATLGF